MIFILKLKMSNTKFYRLNPSNFHSICQQLARHDMHLEHQQITLNIHQSTVF